MGGRVSGGSRHLHLRVICLANHASVHPSDYSTIAAADFGFQVMVADDACATRDLKYGETVIPAEHVHKAFLAALKSYGQVMSSDQVIDLLAAEMVIVPLRTGDSVTARNEAVSSCHEIASAKSASQ